MNPQVHVRLPDDLLDWLREDAKTNGRTVAQSIRFYLERAQAASLTARDPLRWLNEPGGFGRIS